MTWKQFVKEYAKSQQISDDMAKYQLRHVFLFLANKIASGTPVQVPRFGKFKRVHRQARKVKVPVAKGAQVQLVEHDLPAEHRVVFIPVPALKHIEV